MDQNAQKFQQKVSLQPIQPQGTDAIQKLPLVHKIVLGVLIVVALLALISGAYYLVIQKNTVFVPNKKITVNFPAKIATVITPTATPSSDDVVNWKTYSNTVLAYSFEYPQGWYLYPPEKSTALDIQTISPASYKTINIDGVPAGDYIDVFVYNNFKNLSIEAWTRQELQIPIKLTPETINGNIWYRTTDFPFFIGGEAAFTIQGGKVFGVSWTEAGGKLIISPDEFQKILSSFKFTN